MRAVALFAALATAHAQLIGHGKNETHLALPIQHCTKAAGCAFEKTSAVLDSNWRWLHKEGCTNSSKCNCFLGNGWVNATCGSVDACTKVCALDGEDEKGYQEKYGITADGSGLLNLTFVTKYQTKGASGTNVGSRLYLLEDSDHYKMFNLLNRELTFTVDSSHLPCGLNGALYFVEMDADGGKSKYPSNKAGAQYGTGYCDAQCPHDMKWISGEANLKGWKPSSDDPNAGHGHYGSCCAELDIWEANKISTQMTVHSCEKPGAYRCEGVECGDNNGKNASDPGDRFKGVCDKNGCDYNPYREGAHTFYGPGAKYTLDTTKPMRVVTQFITDDGTDAGKLKEMRRFYMQDNKTYHNPTPLYGPGPQGQKYDAISAEMCDVQMTNFTDRLDVFKKKGGVEGMGEAMRRSMALVLSLWDDHDVGMIWLDATDPYPIPPGKWGAPRGTCNQTSGNYTLVEKLHGDSYVLFSDFRYGEIGTTYGPGAPPPPPSCPGGSKDACIKTCNPADPTKYLACIKNCEQHCPHMVGDQGYKAGVYPETRRLAEAEAAEAAAAASADAEDDRAANTTTAPPGAAAAGCTPNDSHGCLNGKPYDFATEFPCGAHDVFSYDSTSCCEQGRSFSTQNEYCCTGSGQHGVHDYSKGKCDFKTPDACACYDAVETPAWSMPDADSLVDTSTPPEGGYLCDGTESKGCLNGYVFDFATQVPCGSWLMEYGKYGCCPSPAGFLPYPLGAAYCCKVEGAPPGKDYNISTTPCKCHRYGCTGK